MNHAKNERIAMNLRALADRIEQSPREYSAEMSAYGGEIVTVAIGEPPGFGPIGATLVIGDADFVKSHQVVRIEPTGN